MYRSSVHRTTSCSTALVTALMQAMLVCSAALADDLRFKLVPNDRHDGDDFGISVAQNGQMIAVGAPRHAPYGAVYVYGAMAGDEIFRFEPDEALEYRYFGQSLAVSGDACLVGSPTESDDKGLVYTFSLASGDKVRTFQPHDAMMYSAFGWCLSSTESVVAVGAPWWGYDGGQGVQSGAAYLFDIQSGQELVKLVADDAAEDDSFGYAIAVDSGIVAVGAPGDDDLGNDSGSVYLFDAVTGEQLAKVHAADGSPGDGFGTALAMRDGHLVVAVDDKRDEFYFGAAYLFEVATGRQVARLRPNEDPVDETYGWPGLKTSVAIANGRAFVGGWTYRRWYAGSGCTWAFDTDTGAQVDKLIPNDESPGNDFGWALEVDAEVLVAGAPGDFHDGIGSGSVYVFSLAGECVADMTGDGVVDTRDFLAFLNLWVAGDPIADWNDDGTVNTQDFLVYLNDWAAGC